MSQIDTSLQSVPGIGPKIAQMLNQIPLSTVADLIYYFPRAWEDLSKITPISELTSADSKFTIQAVLATVATFRSPIKRMYLTNGKARDSSGRISLVWFNQPYLRTALKPDQEYFFTGKVNDGRSDPTMVNPNFEPVTDTPLHSGRIIPVYPEHKNITSKIFRRIMRGLVSTMHKSPEILPASIVSKYRLLPFHQALVEIHFPTSLDSLQVAKDRLSFDELLTTQLTIQQINNYLKNQTARPIPTDTKLVQSILKDLPWQLTDSQTQALQEILQDIAGQSPANRLLEGDVGSGKTIVAAIAMIVASRGGFQSALMVPTEVLAKQHFDKLKSLFASTKTAVALRTNIWQEGSDDADIIIGTHALIHSRVSFNNLNLVIIDEQHRFGVKQREALKHKGHSPHFISLTATPIPRSLALGIFGDLDISIIANRPQHRPKIVTQVLSDTRRKIAYQKIMEEVAAGHQAFVVAPLVAISKTISAKSVEQEFAYIKKQFPNVRVGLLHGRLDATDKQTVMDGFASGKIQVLVATTVVEVGIDIPNATVMLIEGAERFGLAQLHQLRGRVGRSELPSYCFVIPSLDDQPITSRLDQFAKLDDGFKLAELDLKIRGPGALFGQLQSGWLKYKLADWTDAAAIKRVREAAKIILDSDPHLTRSPELKNRISIEDVVLHRE